MKQQHQILFRGISVAEPHQWYFGYFVYFQGKCFIFKDHFDILQMVEVVPETLSRFTGQIDKNSCLIFEDDLVHAKQSSYNFNAVVRWGVKSNAWKISCPYPCTAFSRSFKCFALPPKSRIEVIGNIHENPEHYNDPMLNIIHHG